MRAAYTSAVAAYLLEKGVYFDNVYGVSAGSSNAVNYVSRDVDRTIISFTDFVAHGHTGNVFTFLAHKGLLNAHYIYQESGLPTNVLPFDIDTFNANPAKTTITSFERDTGHTVFYTQDDMRTCEDLMIRVRASSTLPLFMPPPTVNGKVMYDGGFGEGGGLPIGRIERDGLSYALVVRSRQRGYRKHDKTLWDETFFWRYPLMAQAVRTRSARYNAACNLLDRWEEEGRAYVFYCDDLTLTGSERDYEKLCRNFEAGYRQVRRDWGKIEDFLGRTEA